MDTIKKVTEEVRKQTSQKGCYPITPWLVKMIIDKYEKIRPGYQSHRHHVNITKFKKPE